MPQSSVIVVRPLRVLSVVLLACVLLAPTSHAQGLGAGLLDRYLDALRLQFGIPGLSAALVQDGRIVWQRGYGYADVASAVPVTPTTPFPVLGLTQSISAAYLLGECVDSGRLELTDRVIRWTPFADASTTITDLLAHVSATGSYRFDPARFDILSGVTLQCAGEPFGRGFSARVLDRLAMFDSLPGRELADVQPSRTLPGATIERYAAVARRIATPYRVDARQAAARSEFAAAPFSPSSGLISTARDLASFDAAIGDGLLMSDAAQAAAWSAPAGRPTGLGWFVQSYNGQRVVWQAGLARDAYSTLMVKLPDRRLTLVLLANSDALTSAISQTDPDVTASLFARTFLRLFVN